MTCCSRTAFSLSLPLLAALALAACGRPERLPEPAAPPAGTALKVDLPPAYDEARLIEIEQPRGSTVRIGIAPETISVDAQAGVVRYVAVMRGISARVATYEGIRCNGGQWRAGRRMAPGWRQAWSGKTCTARASNRTCGFWRETACALARPSTPTCAPSCAACKAAAATCCTGAETPSSCQPPSGALLEAVRASLAPVFAITACMAETVARWQKGKASICF